MPKIYDLTGKKFGTLSVIRFSHRDKRTFWIAKCELCGIIKTYLQENLVRAKSCGCLTIKNRTTQNGHTTKNNGKPSPEYSSWKSMLYSRAYKNYAKRGITVCERWMGKDGFRNFLADMGTRPPHTTIERIDNDKGYYPENCKWGTIHEQNRNQRRNRWIEYMGKKMVLTDWANKLGISLNTFNRKMKKGLSFEEIVRDEIPMPENIYVSDNGELKDLTDKNL